MTNEEATITTSNLSKIVIDKSGISLINYDERADCISRQAVLDLVNADWKYEGLETDVASLPSVTPQPKTGHWARVTDKTGHLVWECDKCGWQQRFNTDFCPDCGCRMVESQESEDEE